ARLATDADRRVGEEADPLVLLVAVAEMGEGGEIAHFVLRSRSGSLSRCGTPFPRQFVQLASEVVPLGRRPARMSQVDTFSWMCVFGSSAMCVRSFAEPPLVNPRKPQ